MKSVAFVNQKGGVGKSSGAVHVGYQALDQGKRVLLVDLDPMASMSDSFPPTGASEGRTSISTELFAPNSDIRPEVLSENLHIIRGHKTLAQLSEADRETLKRPGEYLRGLASNYDVCVIDTPGMIGFNPPMTIAALVAAGYVVCPFNIGLYEARALAELWEYLHAVKAKGYNPQLRLLGLLPSKIETTSTEEMQALKELRSQFGDAIMPLMLGARVSVKQAIMRRKPVWKGTRGAGHLKAAKEWRAATIYILQKMGVK